MSTGFGGGGGDGLGDLFASVRIDTSGAATGVNEVREAMQSAAGAAEQLEGAADRASGSLRRKADSARTATDSSRQLADQSRQTAHQLLQVGRIADDAQYIFQHGMGLRPIINNLIEINPLLGLAALGVDLMIRHWDKLNDVLDPDRIKVYSGALEELKRHIKDLEASKPELAVDLRQLDNARDQLEDMMRKKHAFDQLMSGQTAIEIESGKAFQKAISEAPGGPEAVEEAIRGKMAEQVVQVDPKFKAKSAEMEEARQRIEEVQKRMETEDPVLRAMSQIQISGIEHRMREVTNELGVIRGNARTQAKLMTDQMLGGARRGEAKDLEKAIGWMQGIGIDRPTVFKAELARPEAVVLPEDRRKTEQAIHQIVRAEEKVQRDTEAAAHGAQLKSVQDAQRATEAAAHAFAMRAGGTGPLEAGFTQASVAADLAAGGMAEADVKKLAEGIYKRALVLAKEHVSRHAAQMGGGTTFEAAFEDLRSKFDETQLRRDEAEATRLRRRAGETPEQHAARLARERQERRDRTEREKHERELERSFGGEGAEETAYGLIGQIAAVRGARQRQRANALIDRELQQLGRQSLLQRDPDLDPQRAAQLAAEAPGFFRRSFARRRQNIGAVQGAGAGVGFAPLPLNAAERAAAHHQQQAMEQAQEQMVAQQFVGMGVRSPRQAMNLAKRQMAEAKAAQQLGVPMGGLGLGGGVMDIGPPVAPGAGFRSVPPSPQVGGELGALGNQLATNQAGLVNGQARLTNSVQQARAYAEQVGQQVQEMMRWQARQQPQRGNFWPGYYGGF